MKIAARRLATLVVTTVAVGGLTGLVAPAASADPQPSRVVAERWDQPRCKPVHTGRAWRWDDRGRRGGHWDHREWNRRTHRFEWKHMWRDDRRCERPRWGDRDWRDDRRDDRRDDQHDDRHDDRYRKDK